jgi:hypothetical protein
MPIRHLRSAAARGLAASAVLCLAAVPTRAQQSVAGGLAVEVAPHTYVVTDRGVNLVLIAGERSSMLAGPMAPALVDKARRAADALHAPPVRWVAVMDADSAAAWEDGGWEARGATAIAHEGLRHRLIRARRAAFAQDSAAVANRTTRLPSMGFSEVVQLGFTPGEEAHLVKQPDGTRDSDVAIHFEGAGVLYLGSLTTDGYPEIRAGDGGTMAGLIKTVDDFAEHFSGYPAAIEPIVPARGPLATLADLRAFGTMLKAVRDRLTPLMDQGKTVEQAVATHPTADLDARWGRGPVSPDAFVRMAWAALAKERTAAPTP